MYRKLGSVTNFYPYRSVILDNHARMTTSHDTLIKLLHYARMHYLNNDMLKPHLGFSFYNLNSTGF
jgi:hypothetical protein